MRGLGVHFIRLTMCSSPVSLTTLVRVRSLRPGDHEQLGGGWRPARRAGPLRCAGRPGARHPSEAPRAGAVLQQLFAGAVLVLVSV